MSVGRHTLCLVLSHSNAKLLKAYRFPLWKLSLSPVSPLTVYSNRGTWHECVEASLQSADSVGIRLRIDFPSNIWTKKCDILFLLWLYFSSIEVWLHFNWIFITHQPSNESLFRYDHDFKLQIFFYLLYLCVVDNSRLETSAIHSTMWWLEEREGIEEIPRKMLI